jgi:drug/metabolite transporter (DMT)-like permease
VSSIPRRTVLYLIIAAACWGLGTVISKRAIGEIPPLTLLPIQLAASLAVLATWMRLRGLPFRDPSASPLLGRLGIVNPGLAYGLSLLGLVHITASVSVMVWAIEPILILLLAAIYLRERVGPLVLLLSMVAVAGMLLVVYQPGIGGSALGVLLSLAGVACCAIYTVATRRWLASADSTAQVVLAQEAHALVFTAALVAGVAVLGGPGVPGGVSAAAWVSAIASGILYYAVAYGFYLSALRRVPASIAATSFYLIPVFGVAGGNLFLGEQLQTTQWVGAVLVLVATGAVLLRTTQPNRLPQAGVPVAPSPHV